MEGAREIFEAVAQGRLTVADAVAQRGAPVVEVCDTVFHELAPARVFTVCNALGGVHVERVASRSRLQVDRRAVAETEAQARALLQAVEVTVDAREVRVRRAQDAAVRADLTVWLSDLDAVVVEGTRVEMRGLRGELVCRAHDEVHVTGCGGSLDARLRAGEARVDDTSGRICLEVGRGSIRVSQASGYLEARCDDGDIVVERFAGDVRARAPRGEVRVIARRAEDGDPMRETTR